MFRTKDFSVQSHLYLQHKMSNGAIELAEFATPEWYHVMMDINAQR